MPLTDLILASKSEAQEIANSKYPLGKWAGIDTKGIDVVSYSNLYCILVEQMWRPETLDEFPLMSVETDDGSRVAIFPARMTNILADLQSREIDKTAKCWSETDELKRFELSEVKGMLEKICGLSKEAISSGKDILIWMAL